MDFSSKDILNRSGFVDEAALTALVEGDKRAGSAEVGGGSPAIISAISATVGGATAVSAFVTSSGLCPTFSCTNSCTGAC